MNGNSSFFHFPDIFHRHGEGISHFLHCIGTASGEHFASRHDGTKMGCILPGPADRFCHVVIAGRERLDQSTILYQLSQRIGTDYTMKFTGIFSLCFQCSSCQCNHADSGRSAVHHERIGLKIKAIQKMSHVFQRRNRYAGVPRFFRILHIHTIHGCTVKTDIIHRGPLIDFMLQKLIIFGRQRLVTGLGNAPGRFLIAIHRRPPEIITHPWIIIKRQVLIHSYRTGAERVNGIERNAFISFRIHEFIKRLAFEKCIAGIHPFFPCGRCEFIKFNCREIRFSFRFFKDRFKLFICQLFYRFLGFLFIHEYILL